MSHFLAGNEPEDEGVRLLQNRVDVLKSRSVKRMEAKSVEEQKRVLEVLPAKPKMLPSGADNASLALQSEASVRAMIQKRVVALREEMQEWEPPNGKTGTGAVQASVEEKQQVARRLMSRDLSPPGTASTSPNQGRRDMPGTPSSIASTPHRKAFASSLSAPPSPPLTSSASSPPTPSSSSSASGPSPASLGLPAASSSLMKMMAGVMLSSSEAVEEDGGEGGPLTPRSIYSKVNADKLRNMVALLMRLDMDAMRRIREEFRRRHWALSVYDFVLVTQANMPSASSAEETDALVAMFREIDVNGDGTMQWEEFTSHLVDLASSHYQESKDEHMPHYRYSLLEDTSSHDYHCDFMRYFPGLERLVVFERSSRRVKLYDTKLRLKRMLRGHRGPLLSAEYIPSHEMLVTSGVDKNLCFWDNRPGRHLELNMQWQTKHYQVTIKWLNDALYTADTEGSIICWQVERGEQRLVMKGHSDVVMDMCVLASLGMIASAGLDRTIRLWELNKGAEKLVLSGHEKGVVYLAYSERYQLLISGGLDPYALVWNPRVKTPIFTIPVQEPLAHVIGVQVGQKSGELVVADNRGNFGVYDLRTLTCVQTFVVPKIAPHQISSFVLLDTEGALVA